MPICNDVSQQSNCLPSALQPSPNQKFNFKIQQQPPPSVKENDPLQFSIKVSKFMLLKQPLCLTLCVMVPNAETPDSTNTLAVQNGLIQSGKSDIVEGPLQCTISCANAMQVRNGMENIVKTFNPNIFNGKSLADMNFCVLTSFGGNAKFYSESFKIHV